jgi:hypothetical protein
VQKNKLINGAMQIAQRGTSIAVAGDTASKYTLDRWYCRTVTSSSTITQQTPTTANYYKSLRAQRDSGQAAGYTIMAQAFETTNIADLRGQYVTVSFVVKAGATFITNVGSFAVAIYCGTGTERARGATAYTSETTILNNSIAVSATETLFSFTSSVVVPTNTTQMEISFAANSSVTAGATEWYEITNVQLEAGSSATPFERRLYNQELANCQRYYWKISGATTDRIALGHNSLTTAAISTSQFPVTLRTAPTALEQSGTASHYDVQHANTATTCSAVPTFLTASINMATSTFTVASGLTAGQGSNTRLASTSGYLAWSAEL